jgi:hypothetical protein
VSHVEERKNDQIDHIKKSHEKAFNEIKNYYNDITLNNLAMIATLKEEIRDRELKIERSEKQVSACSFVIIYITHKIETKCPLNGNALKKIVYALKEKVSPHFRFLVFAKQLPIEPRPQINTLKYFCITFQIRGGKL